MAPVCAGLRGPDAFTTATRIQFYAYEIARNRLGLNAKAHELAVKEAEKERLEKEKKAKGKGKANGKS